MTRDVEADRVLDGRRPAARRRAATCSSTPRAPCAPRVERVALPHRRRHAASASPTPASCALNDIGRVHLRTARRSWSTPTASNRATGAFILVDEASNDTVGAGMVTAVRAEEKSAAHDRVGAWTTLLERLDRAAAAGDPVEDAVREALEDMRRRGLLTR